MAEIDIPPATLELAARTWWETTTKRDWSYASDAIKEAVRVDQRAVLAALAEADYIDITRATHG